MRLSEIMHGGSAVRKPKRRWLYATLAAALVPVAALQFAWAQQAAPTAAAPVPAKVQRAAQPATAAAPAFMAPVDGPISLAFGMQLDPVTGKTRFHQGVDFPVPVGTPVRASADGKVSAIADKWGYGKVIEIDHGNGLMTRLAHLDSQTVAVGDDVKVGQVVATSGNSGGAGGTIGPHLHFEVWKDGRPQNPVPLLGLKVAEATTSYLRADRLLTHGSLMTGRGDAQLTTDGEIVHADYIQWDRASGETKVRGNITIDHADGTKTTGGAWRKTVAGSWIPATTGN